MIRYLSLIPQKYYSTENGMMSWGYVLPSVDRIMYF